MNYILITARSVLVEAIRSRLPWMALIVTALVFGLAAFLHQVALTEQRAIQIAVMAALLRAAGVFLVVSFVITSMVREANDKVIELLLSQPAPRLHYLVGKYMGHAAVAIGVALLFGLALQAFAPFPATLIWAGSLAFELLVMTAISLFCVLSLSHTVPAFAATAGFYLLGRSIGTMRLMAASPLQEDVAWSDTAVRWLIDALSFLLPGLDRLTLSSWLLEGPPGAAQLGTLAMQTSLYIALIGFAALFDLYRKSL